MSSVVTGTNTFPNSFIIPDVGELAWGPVANSSIKSLANRTIWLKNNVDDIIATSNLFEEIEIRGQSSESMAGINGGGILFEYDTTTLSPAIAALFSAANNSWMMDTASLSGNSSLYNQLRIYDNITDTAHFSLRKTGNIVIGEDADEIVDNGSKLQILGDLWGYSITLSGGLTISEFSNDTTLSDMSSGALVTEYAVKTYVDNEIATNSFDASGVESSVQFNRGDKLNGSSTFLFDINTSTLSLSGNLNLSNYSVNEISNDVTFTDSSSAALVTEYAVKNYVDTELTVLSSNITGFAGGSDTEVQFNNNGFLSGSNDFVYDQSNSLLTVSNLALANTYAISGFSNDTTLVADSTAGSQSLVPTEYAIKTYTDNGIFAAAGIFNSLVASTSAELQTQIDELSAGPAKSVVEYDSWTGTATLSASVADHYIITPTTIPGTGSNDIYLTDLGSTPDGKEFKVLNRSNQSVDVFPLGADTINGINSSVQVVSGSIGTFVSITTDWAFA